MAPPRDLRQARIRQAVALVTLSALIFGLIRLGQAVVGGGDPAATPSSGSPPVSATIPPLPACKNGDAPTARTAYEAWQFTLVDRRLRLPEDYQPPDLVSAEGAGFAGPYLVRAFLLEDLGALREAAEAAGVAVEVEAAFRTYDQQAALFDQRVAELGEEAALAKVARPGHSEHQLGTTVDFKTAGAEDVDLTWASTPAGAWTVEHAPEFGFVLSYPEGAEAKSCYAYEPWHYRYVGRERAAAVAASGLTLREFLWREAATGSGS